MTDTIERIKALLEADRCIVHPHGGTGCEIQLTYPNGKGSDIWVKRSNDWRGVQISHTGNHNLSLSNADADVLNPLLDKLVYEKRAKLHFYLLGVLDQLEKSA